MSRCLLIVICSSNAPVVDVLPITVNRRVGATLSRLIDVQADSRGDADLERYTVSRETRDAKNGIKGENNDIQSFVWGTL